jgi:hypothetical protein
MVNVFTTSKKKDENTQNIKETTKQEPSLTPTDQPAALLQKMKTEEAKLFEEKRNLTQLKEQLQKKIKDQIENSKNNLQKLKTEIDDLKIECTQLNETLQNDILIE